MKFTKVGIMLACVASQAAFATGIPTVNVIEQGQLADGLVNQGQELEKLTTQINTLKSQLNSITGSYGRGAQGLSSAVSAASVVPGSWQDVTSQQSSGAYGSVQAAVEKTIQTVAPSSFTDASVGSNYKMSTDSVRAGLAGGQSLYAEAQTHLTNFEQLAQQVDATTNVKDAADLQNRMTAELGMAQSAQTKLQALNASLTANQLNASNQATASRQTFFGQTQ